MTASIELLASHLASINQPAVDTSLALLWYLDRTTPDSEATAGELSRMIHSLGIANRPNQTQLKKQLKTNKSLVLSGKRPDTFRLSLNGRKELSALYES